MKKVLILFFCFLAFGVQETFSQPRSIGLRLVTGYEVQYQHNFTDVSFLEAAAGVDNAGSGNENGLKFTCTYNWEIAHPDWSRKGAWVWYMGPGVTTGYVNDRLDDDDPGFMIGLAFQVGCEYTFDFPISLAADVRPVMGYHAGTDSFYDCGLRGLIPSLSVKYRF